MPGRLNLPFLAFQDALGGVDAIPQLKGFNSTDENKKYSLEKSWVKIEGQKLTRLTAQRFINEILALNPEKALKDIKVYFDHSAIKNSRSMQKGPATPQGNKFSRQAIIFGAGTLDLTKAEGLRAWKLTLAQKIGKSTNKEKYKNYEQDVQEFLDYIKDAPVEIKDLFESYINTDDTTIRMTMDKSLTGKKSGDFFERNDEEEDSDKPTGNQKLIDYYKKLADHFKDYDLMSEEGQNAVLEAFRYTLATKAQKQNFEPHIFLEIDGTNDGPSWANRLFGIVKGQFSPEFIRNNIKTGFFPLIDAVNQDNVLNELNGTEDKASGIHEDVSKNKFPERMKQDIAWVRNQIGNKRNGITQDEITAYTDCTRAILKLFKIVDMVEGDVDGFMDGKGEITFTKDISKNAVTVVNYGAQVAGLVGQTINMLMDGKYGSDGLYTRLNNLLQEIPTDDDVTPEEKVAKYRKLSAQYKEIVDNFKVLFSYTAERQYPDRNKDEKYRNRDNTYYKYTFKKNENVDLKKYLKGAVDVFPGTDFRVMAANMSKESFKEIQKKFGDTIQGFMLTDAGEQHLTKLLSPIIGEQLHGAVTTAIGSDAMQATKIPQTVGSVLNGLAMAIEGTLLHELNKRGNVTQNDLYKVRRKVKKAMASFTFQSGAKVVAERTAYRTSQKPLYEGRSAATSFYPSRGRLTDIGVAAGALVTQGLGDSATMDRIQRALAEEGISIDAVFDGAYVSPELQAKVERIANEAVMQASRQKPVEVITKRLESACKFLTSDPELSKLLGLRDKSVEAVIGTVIGRLCAQQYLDGTEMTEADKKIYSSRNGDKLQSLQYQFTRSFQQFLYPEIPAKHPFDYAKKRAQNSKKTPDTIISKFHDLGLDLVNYLHECKVAERVKHTVLDDLPQSFHHMAGGETNFFQGNPVGAKEFKQLMKKINSDLPLGRKYATAEEFISAFLAYRADEWAKNHLSDTDLAAWRRATLQEHESNNTTSRTMDAVSAKKIADALGIKEAKPTKVEPYIYKNKDPKVPMGVIRQAFKRLGEKHHANAIYANIFKKVESLLPDNTEVYFYRSKKDLPEEIQKLFNKAGQNGLYVKQNGVPKIYVISQDVRNDWNSEKNLEVFAHEGIHAAISSIIEVWSHNPADILPTQRQALDNLYNLLNDFKSLVYVGRYKPEIIKNFQQILNETQEDYTDENGKKVAKSANLKKAELVDEAMAYILSNEELFDALSKAKFKMAATETHQTALEDLLGKLLKATKKAWAAIMSIITGSPMDQFLTEADMSKLKDGKDIAREFLYFYGANTLTFMNDIGYIRGKGKESKKSEPKASRKLDDDFDTDTLDIESEGENPLVRASRGLGGASVPFESVFRGYHHGKTPLETLTQRYFVKATKEDLADNKNTESFRKVYKWLAANKDSLHSKAKKMAQEELSRLQAYSAQTANALDGLVANPDEVAQLATDLQREGVLTPTDKRNMTYLYRRLQDKITDPFCFAEADATQEEKANSVRLYNLLKGKEPSLQKTALSVEPETLIPNFRDQALFFAIAGSDPAVNKLLGSISVDIEKQASQRQKGTFGRVLADTFNGILNALSKEQIKADSTKDLVTTAVDYSEPKSGRSFISKALDRLDYEVATLPLTVTSLIPKWKITKEDKNKVAFFLQNFPTLRHDLMVEVMRNFANRHIPVKWMDFVRDFYGRTPSNTEPQRMLKESKGYIDKSRHETLISIASDLLKAFGVKKMKTADRAFYHRLLSMHLSQLNLQDLKDVVHDRVLLDQKMKDLQATIANRMPQGKRQLQKVRQLARYLWGDGSTGVNLLMNPEAICKLLNEQNIDQYQTSRDPQQIHDIGTLLTYYGIRMMEEGDLNKLKDTYAKNQTAFENLINALKNIEEDEQTRADAYHDQTSVEIAANNRRFGWLPKGNKAKGEFRYVTAKERAEYEAFGWKILDDPVADPHGVLKEPMYKAWNTWVESKTRQEGIFQQIKQTLWGWDVDDNKQVDAIATRLREPDVVERIQKLERSGVKNTGFIPVFNEMGDVVGYDIAPTKAERALYLENRNDPFSGIAQWVSRQERESIAGPINDKALAYAVKRYTQASDSDKKKMFIDVFNTDNPHIKRAVQNMNNRTYTKIVKAFGGNHCYIEKDEVYTFFGYMKPSLTDMWKNEFILPSKIEDVLVKCLDAIFGGKARKWLSRSEAIVASAATWARETIIIRSGFVPMRNIIGNLLLLESALRIPPKHLYKLVVESLKDTEVYNTLRKQELDLKNQLNVLDPHDSRREAISKKIQEVQEQYKNLRVFPLIEKGEYSTIDMEGTTYDSIELQKDKIGEYFDNFVSRVPDRLRNTVKNIALTKDSDTFQALSKMTNYGDWIAKCVAYRYLTEESESNPVATEETSALNIASTLFVDYDQFVGPERDWLNRMGITWFTTFKYRMITAAMLGMSLHPGSMVLGTIFDTTMGLAGTPLTDNAIVKLLSGGVLNSLGWGTIFRSIFMHPAIAAAALIV